MSHYHLGGARNTYKYRVRPTPELERLEAWLPE